MTYFKERVIHNLIQEISNMKSPFAKEEAEEAERKEKERLAEEERLKKEAETKAEIERETRDLELDFQRRRSSVAGPQIVLDRQAVEGNMNHIIIAKRSFFFRSLNFNGHCWTIHFFLNFSNTSF